MMPEAVARPRGGKTGYLPGLDGWRAIAILGVLMTHDAAWVIFGHSTVAWKGYGGDGIYLFFAISGFLICSRILEEESLVGRFHLKSFYVRRIFRIQPAALVYLAVIAALRLLGWIHEYWRMWFGALFLYQNFQFHQLDERLIQYGLFTGHFWTLSVEEHFYLLLSLLLFAVRRYRIAVFAALLLCLHYWQKFATLHGYLSPDVSLRRTYWVLQWLMWPSLVAMVVRLPAVRQWCVRWLRPWVAFAGTLVLVLVRESRESKHVILNPLQGHLSGQRVLILYLVTFWLVATALHPRSWTTRLLELPPMRFVGRISYSLYLWHVLFFAATAEQVTFAPLRALGQRPLKYFEALAAACLSYYLVEKPLMRYGHRLAPPATAGRLDMADLPVEARPVTAAAGG